MCVTALEAMALAVDSTGAETNALALSNQPAALALRGTWSSARIVMGRRAAKPKSVTRMTSEEKQISRRFK